MHDHGKSRAGRPKALDKRHNILCAAGDCFLQRGYLGTSMDAVAQSAGVSKQTVYSHFAGKEALFEAVIGHKVASYGFSRPDLSGAPSLRTGLAEIGARFLQLLFDPEVIAMHRLVIAECTRDPALARMFWAQGPQRSIDAVAGFLAPYLADGGLAGGSADELASQFLFMLGGELKLQLIMNLRETPIAPQAQQDHVRRAVDQFLRLCAVPPEGAPPAKP